LIDASKLPEFSVVANHLAPVGGYGILDDVGMAFTVFTLKKNER
jgi:hypothetical protein